MPLAGVQCCLESTPLADKGFQHAVLGNGLHAWELGGKGDLRGEGLEC